MAAANESHSSQISIKQVSPEKGKGLFANTNFKEGDIIFEEKPLVCCQFLWNALYKYTACGFCMKSLETAEQMARRLTGNATLELPHAAKCCEIVRSGQKVVNCHSCQVLLVLISCSRLNLYYFVFYILANLATYDPASIRKSTDARGVHVLVIETCGASP